MKYKWMDQDSNKWSSYIIESYIIYQNTYHYDGEKSIWHSADSLIQFCYMTNKKQVKKFRKIHDRITEKWFRQGWV